ncbi:unnamed protein product [Closterium sp. Yama58-4]|nr:unnamed protein product [Closterium sp. Yama58-4]
MLCAARKISAECALRRTQSSLLPGASPQMPVPPLAAPRQSGWEQVEEHHFTRSCKQQASSITAAGHRAKNGVADFLEAPASADYWNKLVTMKTQVLITILLCLALAHAAQASSSNFEKYAVRNSVRSGSAHRLRWRKLTELPTCVNQTLCGSLCVDILTDINNCGVCSNFCDLTQICCNGTCINPNTNNAHCGACGARCPGTCAAGVCNYGGVISSPGKGGAGNGGVVPPAGGSGGVVPGTGGGAAGGKGKP